MKTTIDIPEALYKRAKIRAVEQSTSLKELVLRGLEHELENEPSTTNPDNEAPYFARRVLLPSFARLQAEGAFYPKPSDRDITELISEDRNARH